ncbi:paraquat-inducible protein A [Wenxinia saemankumensis]|uniref:Paraquat-inducible protein A n=1 Tax=Wenxinia saemankumensis TaxID=1447782 RepID=A0A1M6A8V3_9RHOB|nr:paraquat-inducible protein A [Wenxinia saemankumensis]SHI32879.1 paraquat-inducible protein A [Wenxinia saemankumensis]
MTDQTDLHAAEPAELIACPICDALYRVEEPAHGERAVCARCGHVLIAPRRRAGMSIIMLALATVILTCGAVFFPFLRISTAGFGNSATILDTALAFTDGPLLVLSLAVLALIVLVPVARAALTIYVLSPLVFDRPAWPGAIQAFRMSEALQPWSMAEIFAIGCAVALVKVADLATLEFGPAFWMFAVLTVVIVLQDRWLDRWLVWNTLDREVARAARTARA